MDIEIPKVKALNLIDQTIFNFEELEKNASSENTYDSKYEYIYNNAESIIENLFGTTEMEKFREYVANVSGIFDDDNEKFFKGYLEHLKSCIIKFRVYRDTIDRFWS